jgi:16S rRNA (cytidine1402-2'-O)-methyltransferase
VTDPGVLVLVGTPIGNLADLAPRAVESWGGRTSWPVRTRRTGRLLAHIGVRAPSLLVVNDHTEVACLPVLARLGRVNVSRWLTDAGMPGISDPGERLVAATPAAGFAVEVVPGPSAAITALVVSGLPTSRFVFEGFLPRKGAARAERLRDLVGERRTIVLYEAPHRVARTLADLVGALGPARQVVLARELTKLHEETWRGSLAQAVDRVTEVEPRGEFVLVVDGARPPPSRRRRHP